MCVSALLVRISLYHMCAWCPRKPKERIRFPETGVIDSCRVGTGIEPRSSGRTACALNGLAITPALKVSYFNIICNINLFHFLESPLQFSDIYTVV